MSNVLIREQNRLKREKQRTQNKENRQQIRDAKSDLNTQRTEAKEALQKAKQDEYKAKHATPQDPALVEQAENSVLEKAKILSGINTNLKNVGKNNTTENPVGGPDRKAEDDNKTNEQAKKLNKPLSDNFYNSLSNTAKAGLRAAGTQTNTEDVMSAGAQAQADALMNQQAKAEKQEAWHNQKANQDPYAEAGKIASMQNAAVNKQNIEQNRNKTGKSVGRLRATTTPDVMTQKNYAAQQMTQGEGRSDVAAERELTGLGEQMNAEGHKVLSKEYNSEVDDVNRITKGEGDTDTVTRPTRLGVNRSQTPNNPEGAPVTNNSDLVWSNPNFKEGNLSSGKQGLKEKLNLPDATGPNPDAFNTLIDWLNQSPDFDIGGLTKSYLLTVAPAEEKSKVEEWLTQRASDKTVQYQKNVNSDIRIKDLRTELSDLRMKFIKEDYDRDGTCSPEDFAWLAEQQGGKYTHGDREYDFFNDDDWADDEDDSVLNGYAEHIRNFLYTYKPEATNIDPDIDPNEEHIGPMAQDIEQVNPACIKETEAGVKTVDTGRLAMMNAGAIGDIARQLKDLVERLERLEAM